MGKIHILDMEISNQIAAGEVVERPVSVIKEMVENSIDAGADMITVEIKNGGRTYIRVTDNGSGMAEEDAHIAFLRHATSKIQAKEDLDAIYTLGFRGEALSSIGAVARVELYTKRREDPMGTCVTCCGGEIISSEDAGAADGTTFIVKDLFYNTPARRKFMKKDATESGHIQDVMTRFILAYPGISFRLISNGRQQLFSPGDHNLINSVYTVYGKDYASNMLTVDYEYEGVRVTGVIGNSNLSRPNRSFQSFFVNRRYIKSPMLIRALEDAYKNQIMIGKYPVAALNIEINPASIDINVHPTKLEVKFSQEKPVYEAVYHAVKSSLYAMPNVPKIQRTDKQDSRDRKHFFDLCEEAAKNLQSHPGSAVKGGKASFVPERKAQEKEIPLPKQLAVPKKEKEEDLLSPLQQLREVKSVQGATAFREPEPSKQIFVNQETSAAPLTEDEQDEPIDIWSAAPQQKKPETVEEEAPEQQNDAAALPQEKPEMTEQLYEPDVRIVGQLFHSYIVAQRENEMLLIDQHAAHERIKYEELKKAVESKTVYPQMLLEPVIIQLGGAETAVFEDCRSHLEDMGFECDLFGDSQIIVRTSPDGVEWAEIEEIVIELLTQFAANKKELITQVYQRALYTIACKAAVKANHDLTMEEMQHLVGRVFAMGNINTCPHGRPIVISMTKKEIEKEFKRIV